MIQPPQKDQPVDELWRTVAELTEVVNAVLNGEVRVHAKSVVGRVLDISGVPTGQLVDIEPFIKSGRLLYTGGKFTIIIQ